MSATHVSVDYVEPLSLNPCCHSRDFARPSLEFAVFKANTIDSDFLQPAALAAKHNDFVTIDGLLFRKELAVRQCSIDVAARNDLQDLQRVVRFEIVSGYGWIPQQRLSSCGNLDNGE